ncbi:MAG TPA: PIN domain-containing protein [Candidatus Limnocylindria bacterium]|nr:PIN domain-containing protein [Candidatus Limnocylindria bacterium]
MSLTRLTADVPGGTDLLLDSSALIAYFGSEPTTPIVAHIVDDWIASGRNFGVVSPVTAMELSVRPWTAGVAAVTSVIDFLSTFPNVRVIELDRDGGLLAGKLRADLNLSAADALIVATGARASVRHVVTNDGMWAARLPGLGFAVVALKDFLPFP